MKRILHITTVSLFCMSCSKNITQQDTAIASTTASAQNTKQAVSQSADQVYFDDEKYLNI